MYPAAAICAILYPLNYYLAGEMGARSYYMPTRPPHLHRRVTSGFGAGRARGYIGRITTIQHVDVHRIPLGSLFLGLGLGPNPPYRPIGHYLFVSYYIIPYTRYNLLLGSYNKYIFATQRIALLSPCLSRTTAPRSERRPRSIRMAGPPPAHPPPFHPSGP